MEEASKYLGVSKSTLYKLTSTRKITFTKPNGGKIYFNKSNLDEWLQLNEVPNVSLVKQRINQKISCDGRK